VRARACVDQFAGITKSARSRSSAPNGTPPGVSPPARWRAGHTWARAITVSRKVTRSACFTSPAFASSTRASSGRIGNPAASPEVQVSGRIARDRRSQAALE